MTSIEDSGEPEEDPQVNFFYDFSHTEREFIEEVLEGVSLQLQLAVDNGKRDNESLDNDAGFVVVEDKENKEKEEEPVSEEGDVEGVSLWDVKKYVQDDCKVTVITMDSPISFLESVNKNLEKHLKSHGITTLLQLSEMTPESEFIKGHKVDIQEAIEDSKLIVEILKAKKSWRKSSLGLLDIQEKIQEQWQQNVGGYVNKLATSSAKLQQISFKKLWGLKNTIWQSRNKFTVQDLSTNEFFTLELSHAGVSLFLHKNDQEVLHSQIPLGRIKTVTEKKPNRVLFEWHRTKQLEKQFYATPEASKLVERMFSFIHDVVNAKSKS